MMAGKIRTAWEEMPPERKRVLMVIVLLAVLFAAATVFRREKAPLRVAESKTDMTLVTPTRKDEGMAELRTQMATMMGELGKDREENKRLNAQVADLMQGRKDSDNRQVQDLQKEVGQLRDELKLRDSAGLSGRPGSGVNDRGLPALPPPIETVKKETEAPRPKITVQGESAPAPAKGDANPPASPELKKAEPEGRVAGGANKSNAPERRATQYIPAGSFLQGVLLNGVDAPTSGMGQKNPVPVVVRLKQNAILPNRYTHDLRECHVVMAGTGLMSSERVRLRAELLSCVLADGGVIETKIDGYAVDNDGKEGLHGQVVTKQGAVLARGLTAGFLSGFGQILVPTATPAISFGSGSTQQLASPDLGDAARGGAMRGISQAAADISKFYLDTAKEMYPVVELPSGVEVTIMLVHGVQLAIGQAPKESKWSGGWFGH